MVGTLLQERDDEWQVAERPYFSTDSKRKIDQPEGREFCREVVAAIA